MNQSPNQRQQKKELMKNNGKEQSYESFYDFYDRIKRNVTSKTALIDESLEENIILDDRPEEFFWKITITGDGAVGKTTLRKRYLGENFTGEYIKTIGADFATCEEKIGEKKVKFVIWDLAGQPHFKIVRRAFYRGAQGALLVCDLTNPISFENCKHWINELWSNSGIGPVPFVVVGNKNDLKEAGILGISSELIKDFATKISSTTRKKYGFGIASIITSAKTGYNVNRAFKQLGIQIIAHKRYIDRIP